MKAVYIGTNGPTAEVVGLALRLRWPDTTPLLASAAGEGLELVERERPDMVLMQPDFNDMTLGKAIQEMRRFTNLPLMVLGRDGDEMEVVTSLVLGADDYVRLPCDLTEIMVRVWVLQRRVGAQMVRGSDGPLRSGELFINPATYEVFLGERRITLTSTEFRLIHLLIKNRGSVVSRRSLEQVLWGDQVDCDRLVKKYVQRLRRKLGDDAQAPRWIACVNGIGYRFVGPTQTNGQTPVRIGNETEYILAR